MCGFNMVYFCTTTGKTLSIDYLFSDTNKNQPPMDKSLFIKIRQFATKRAFLPEKLYQLIDSAGMTLTYLSPII